MPLYGKIWQLPCNRATFLEFTFSIEPRLSRTRTCWPEPVYFLSIRCWETANFWPTTIRTSLGIQAFHCWITYCPELEASPLWEPLWLWDLIPIFVKAWVKSLCFKSHFLGLVEMVANSVPLETVNEEEQLYTLNQVMINTHACKYGNVVCIAAAKRLFATYKATFER